MASDPYAFCKILNEAAAQILSGVGIPDGRAAAAVSLGFDLGLMETMPDNPRILLLFPRSPAWELSEEEEDFACDNPEAHNRKVEQRCRAERAQAQFLLEVCAEVLESAGWTVTVTTRGSVTAVPPPETLQKAAERYFESET